MAKKYLVPIDLNQNELRNAAVHQLASDPGSPVEGQLWVQNVAHDVRIRNNGATVSLLPTSLLSSANTWTSTNVFNGAVTGNNTINLTGSSASSVGGTFSATVHISTGITGATAASRYVGATASGAPASGTFSTGDFIVDQTGTIWVCTSGGTSGTWIRVGNYLLGTGNTWTAAQVFNAAVTGNNTINLTGSGTSSVGGTFTGTALIASGLTGATSASRYVGATASGAPGSGTFVTGDYIVDQSGTMWVCTAGGSPGTWTRTANYLLGATNTWSAGNTFSSTVALNGAVTGSGTINLTGTGAHSVAGNFTAVINVSTGLTGATAASRYVGATASGAPGSGTFVLGDFIIAQNGAIWVCTTGGSPGTWTQVGGGAISPSGTVAAETSYGISSSAGAASTYSRGDHTHGTPTHVAADHSAIKISDLAAPTANVSFNSQKITSLADPTSAQDAATKNYVDNSVAGLAWKDAVQVATTAALAANTYNNGTNGVGATLTANANGVLAAIDGQNLGAATSQTITAATNVTTTITATVASNANLAVGQIVTISGAAGGTWSVINGTWTIASLVSTTQFTFVVGTAPTGSYTASTATEVTAGDRVIVKNEAATANNGIYVVTQVGTAALPYILTRATDSDTPGDIKGATAFVTRGTTNGGTTWTMTTTGGITLGTTGMTWTQFSGASTATAGGGLTATGNVFAVGAGTGITVNADDVAINTSVVARKFVAQIGNGSLTTIVANHALGNQWVNCQVFLNSGTFEEVECDIQLTDANNVTLIFSVAPTSNQYRVVVTG